MNAMVVKKGEFPYDRLARCCKKRCGVGESVIALHANDGSPIRVVLHKRCLMKLLAELPDDRSEIMDRFENLRTLMVETGEFFPKKPRKRKTAA